MNILHLLVSGGTGGIETLCKEYALRSRHRNIIICLWGSGVISEEMEKAGITVLDRTFSKKDVVGTMRYLLEICKQYDIDVIVTQHESPILHFYMNAIHFMRPKIKTIAYAHSNAVDMCEEKRKRGLAFRKSVLRYSFDHANADIAISNSVKDSLYKELKLKRNRVEVVYNGVDLEKFHLGSYKKNNAFTFIYVGRLIEEKGVQNTIKALSMLPKSLPWRLWVVGEGSYKSTLEKMTENESCSDRIFFFGNRRDVPKLLDEADCFVHLPQWEEGFGITIIEAMAAGKVCLCNDNGAIPEIIQDGYNGFLIPTQDIKATSNKMSEIIRNYDTPYMCEVELNARERARAFSIENYVKTVDNLISNL